MFGPPLANHTLNRLLDALDEEGLEILLGIRRPASPPFCTKLLGVVSCGQPYLLDRTNISVGDGNVVVGCKPLQQVVNYSGIRFQPPFLCSGRSGGWRNTHIVPGLDGAVKEMFERPHRRTLEDDPRVAGAFEILQKSDYRHGIVSIEGVVLHLHGGFLHRLV